MDNLSDEHRKSQRKKCLQDFVVTENRKLAGSYSLLVLKELNNNDFDWTNIHPGQFVEIQVLSHVPTLRRPISIHDINISSRELYLLVRNAGEQTSVLCSMDEGQIINLIFPLGNGFDITKSGPTPLLVGGGVGVAPLLYLGKQLKSNGITPTFLLAAKSEKDLLQLNEFSAVGTVLISTDDGSAGHHGLVTMNPALESSQWSRIYCCGPMPMMKGVAVKAHEHGIPCEVSLENSMACGLGACLCCVEDTKDAGNVCVCTEGPVFDIERLKWFD